MQCVNLDNVNFSPSSISAIEEIREKRKLFSLLSGSLPTGVMINIFLGNGPIRSAYNITQTDFELFTQSMSAITLTERRVIQRIAKEQILATTSKENRFWKGVLYGCEI